MFGYARICLHMCREFLICVGHVPTCADMLEHMKPLITNTYMATYKHSNFLDEICNKRTGGSVNLRGVNFQIIYACCLILERLKREGDVCIRVLELRRTAKFLGGVQQISDKQVRLVYKMKIANGNLSKLFNNSMETPVHIG